MMSLMSHPNPVGIEPHESHDSVGSYQKQVFLRDLKESLFMYVSSLNLWRVRPQQAMMVPEPISTFKHVHSFKFFQNTIPDNKRTIPYKQNGWKCTEQTQQSYIGRFIGGSNHPSQLQWRIHWEAWAKIHALPSTFQPSIDHFKRCPKNHRLHLGFFPFVETTALPNHRMGAFQQFPLRVLLMYLSPDLHHLATAEGGQSGNPLF